MKHALFVAFHYPPEASSSGVLRTLKYTRYLVEHGWRATVISPNIDAYSIIDEQLEQQIPSSARVVRTKYLNTKKNLSYRGLYPSVLAVPDRWIGWLPWAVRAGLKVAARDPFDVIYSTSPHATAHVIAWRIARRTLKPWVADFRDPWIEEPPEPGTPTNPLYMALNRWLERRVVEGSDRVITTTLALTRALQRRYPTEAPGKIIPIVNGYDEADFAELPPASGNDRPWMTILHAGSINAEFRNPIPLLVAARACADAGSIDLAKVRFRFLGAGEFASSPALSRAVAELGLSESVECLPRVPYRQSLSALADADLLLLLQASPDTTGLVPAKLYEYLRAQKPVLALVHEGATQEILSITGGGWSVAPERPHELRDAVSRAFALWQRGELSQVRADIDALRRYDRKFLSRELAVIFDDLQGRSAA